MSTIKIYTLTDPRNNGIYYVGASIQSDVLIVGRHLANALTTSVTGQIRSAKLKPIIETIDSTDCVEYGVRLEEYWYHQLKSWGFNLVNKPKKDGQFRYYTPDKYFNPRHRLTVVK